MRLGLERNRRHAYIWVLEIRKKNISPNDVSLVFHEPQKDGVKIHNITFDEHGNFENLPAAYRDFFLSETNSMLGIEE